MSAMTDHIELYRSGLRRKKWRWRYVAENSRECIPVVEVAK